MNLKVDTLSEIRRELHRLRNDVDTRKKPQSAYLVTGWDDIRIPGTSVRSGASAPDLEPWLGAGGLRLPTFNGGATLEQVYFTIQLPHSYKLGTPIYPHVHWGPTTAGAGNVIWNLEYSWVDNGRVSPAAATIQATDAAGGAAWTSQTASFDAITPVNGTNGDILSGMITCRLYRDPTLAGDTYADDASLLEFDFHIRLDTIGSRDVLTK